MVTYETDPFESWGLQILGDPYPFPTPACLFSSQNEPTLYIEQFPRELQLTNHDNVQNDELLAYSLQQELNQLAVTEASGSGDSSEAHQQESFLAQDWIAHSMAYSSSGSDQDKEFEPPTSSSSTETKLCDGEDYYGSLQMTDACSAWDDELWRRLNHMIPIAHVPKINGEIPSTDEATSDHQRLLDRLQLYNLTEVKVQGDGNCQFRALSDQFYRTPEHHNFVRQEIVNQLSAQPEIYAGYVPMAYGDYIEKMSRDGEWGDHVTLQAAADWYGVRICVFTSFKDTCIIDISPNVQKSNRVIFLSFWAEVHYNSIYPEGETPSN
ncbi:OVARIAN TUMOR DOMAIN-containing deubiquitinating enzyme 12-like [Nymphaea colorata]|nr:OVARIAN TUMOR DOMAIN-containing deubiquitinating enzyme 12-like [Nymphaea colorata]XP_031502020.1 OVARIAN TUMOR DOMAIN-containing deubiquitinating enzyme 12-like [Nymphaea colorata]XP_031502021.1 OVARIAN TUMOR DOMAIN-containing deubiquitinating enzyme 12-like [Nymphaea colorata]